MAHNKTQRNKPKLYQVDFLKRLQTRIVFAILLVIGHVIFFKDYLWISLITSILWIVFSIWQDVNRNKAIVAFNDDLERILSGQTKLTLQDYHEGDLSILAANIEKILHRLYEYQASLQNDKTYLADSLADVSHQLRTPLASLQLLLDRLGHEANSPQEKKEIQYKIQVLINRITRLIEDLLLMSKLDAGAIKLD